jgi:hypothetical protein
MASADALPFALALDFAFADALPFVVALALLFSFLAFAVAYFAFKADVTAAAAAPATPMEVAPAFGSGGLGKTGMIAAASPSTPMDFATFLNSGVGTGGLCEPCDSSERASRPVGYPGEGNGSCCEYTRSISAELFRLLIF